MRFELTYPIQVQGRGEVSTIELRRPKGLDIVLSAKTKGSELKQTKVLVGNLSTLAPSDIDQIDPGEDYSRITETLGEWIKGKDRETLPQEISKKRIIDFELKVPVTINGLEITQIVVRRPTVGDLEYLDGLTCSTELEKELRFCARLSSVRESSLTYEQICELDWIDDLSRLLQLAQSFLLKRQQ